MLQTVEEFDESLIGHEYRIFGPPGTGKTRTIQRLIGQAIEDGYNPRDIFVCSFTRAAARTLVQRNLNVPDENIRTLHAAGYAALGGSMPIAEEKVKEWNAKYTVFALSVSNGDDEGVTRGRGDEIFNRVNLNRAFMLPVSTWGDNEQIFFKYWQEWKQEGGYIDFADMIELPRVRNLPLPGNPKLGFFDEFQDFTKAEAALVRHWGSYMEKIWLAGDDDQCQPGWTKVLTSNCGYVRIDELDPATDRLVSYDRTASEINGRGLGHGFVKAEREYSGELLTIETENRSSECTPEHLWLARWTDEAKHPDTHVVYLMRKGDRFRVGWCRLFRSDGIFHLGHRARCENADGAWILRICKNRTEASMYESYVSAQFGLPLITFEPVNGANHYNSDTIDGVFGLLGDLTERAQKCLAHFHLDMDYPIWTMQKVYARRGGTSNMVIEAVNLIPGLMMLPEHRLDSKRVEWRPIADISRREWSGMVYSLGVEKYHLYIADDLVTHNCVYSFKGASADNLIFPALPLDQKTFLPQSYRVPSAVQEYADKWIHQVARREPKVYAPREERGTVRFMGDEREYATGNDATWLHPERLLEDMLRYTSQGKSVMFIASCGYMLDPMIRLLKESGIPFSNKYAPHRPDWNPLVSMEGRTSSADRLLAFLRLSEEVWGDARHVWTPEEFRLWTDIVQAKGVFKHGAKKAFERFYQKLAEVDPSQLDQPLDLFSNLMEWLEPAALNAATSQDIDWFLEHLEPKRRDGMQFPISIIKKYGAKALRKEPDITLGTIHSVKGGEAAVVYVCPDLSRSGYDEWGRTGIYHDGIVRLFYVAMTRAKETVVFMKPSSGLLHVWFPREYARAK